MFVIYHKQLLTLKNKIFNKHFEKNNVSLFRFLSLLNFNIMSKQNKTGNAKNVMLIKMLFIQDTKLTQTLNILQQKL